MYNLLPNHTQSCAFVMVSLGLRCSRFIPKLLGFTTGAALKPAPASAGLNLEA